MSAFYVRRRAYCGRFGVAAATPEGLRAFLEKRPPPSAGNEASDSSKTMRSPHRPLAIVTGAGRRVGGTPIQSLDVFVHHLADSRHYAPRRLPLR